MVVFIFIRGGAVVLVAADIKLASQDGLDALRSSGFKEVHCSVNVAVVGDGHRFLPNAADMVNQLFYVAGAIQQRVVSMQMKVGEFSHGLAIV